MFPARLLRNSMEICKYNLLFTIIVLNSMTLMYLEFNATSLAIKRYLVVNRK